MSEIYLHGWEDHIEISPVAIKSLTSRALKMYTHLILEAWAGNQPDLDALIAGLTSEVEEWSEPTVKRALKELVDAQYIARFRRPTQPSITLVFKVPTDARQITGDPTQLATVRSQVIRRLGTVGSPVIPVTTTGTGEGEVETLASLWMKLTGGLVNPIHIDLLHDFEERFTYAWVAAAIKEAGASKNDLQLRNMNPNYLLSIMKRWSVEGFDPTIPVIDGSGDDDPDDYWAGKKVLR